jgi:hypothetical protein
VRKQVLLTKINLSLYSKKIDQQVLRSNRRKSKRKGAKNSNSLTNLSLISVILFKPTTKFRMLGEEVLLIAMAIKSLSEMIAVTTNSIFIFKTHLAMMRPRRILLSLTKVS